MHDVFESEEKARSFVDSANATTEWYVVWEGRQTGVLGEAEMLAATRGVESVIEGPMSKADADLIWTGGLDGSQTSSVFVLGVTYSGTGGIVLGGSSGGFTGPGG